MTAVFVAATALPYLLAGWIVRRWDGVSPAPPDRRRFEALLLGTAGLAGLLHALLFAGVLSIPAVAPRLSLPAFHSHPPAAKAKAR